MAAERTVQRRRPNCNRNRNLTAANVPAIWRYQTLQSTSLLAGDSQELWLTEKATAAGMAEAILVVGTPVLSRATTVKFIRGHQLR